MMAGDPSDDVKSRFAQRFENDEKDQRGENEKTEQSGQKEKTAGNEQTGERSKTAKNGKTVNIKEAWTNHSVYLPEELTSELGRQYKYLDLELDEEFGMSIQKTRHYYPLIVALGLERLEELEAKEVKEQLDRLEP